MSSEFEERTKKLDAIREAGASPWGNAFGNTTPIQEVVDAFEKGPEEKSFTIAGRITAHRGFGKAAFLDLRDVSGKIQVYARKDNLPEKWPLFKLVGNADWIGVTGTLGKTKTGEISLFATDFELLTKSLRPLPEKWHGFTDPELRYRRRYLDLIANPKVMDTFKNRAIILSKMRRFLDDRGYLEVETPMFHSIPGGAAARPFVTHHNALDRDLYMRIALEIPLKKLMIGGFEKVYEIGRVFRNEGIDTSHNPEFTLLELYHALGDLSTMMELTESLVSFLAKEITGDTKLSFGEKTIDVTPPWPRKDFLELFKEKDIDPANEAQLRGILREKGVDTAGMDLTKMVDEVFGEVIEPDLQDATFVTGQPIEMTPLCRQIPDRPGFADRFESYMAGMELANAYTELNDPQEQRKRLVEQVGEEVIEQGKVDEDFLLAMEHGMPPAGGIGIGIDRLVMLLTNNPSIREVILFPQLREAESANVEE